MLHFLLITSILCGHCAGRGYLKLCDRNVEYLFAGFCCINECIKCDDFIAFCNTSNPNEVVPRGLSPKTSQLVLHYIGPDTELTPDMFDHLSDLTEIKIVGNITSVAPNTFLKQQNLKSLSISEGKLNSLPSHLFSVPNKLEQLILESNRFDMIPTNIFPQIPHVNHMNLRYNKMKGCRSATISPEFENLTRLTWLSLVGYGDNPELCKNVSKDYLLPIKHVQDLDLSESLLFLGDQRILSPLTHLHRLAIDNISPYKECPARARELFHNLPPSLEILIMKNWVSASRVNGSCILNGTVLAGLKELKKLSELDFSESDRVFGNVLESQTFAGFQNITKLYLSWCGISSTEVGVFNAIPNATVIELKGNCLGPRELELYTSYTPSKLNRLNLINTAEIHIGSYPASRLLQVFPHLKTLYLDMNILNEIPDFGSDNNVASPMTYLSLSDNEITHFSTEDGENLCKVMHSLLVFQAERNKLTDISGFSVCHSINEVFLANNQLGSSLSNNLRALGKLYNLEVIDLSSNQIQFILPELLANLSKLKVLILADNQIHSLSYSPFANTPMMQCLDLSGNNLKQFNTSVVSTGPSGLVNLYLQSNEIATLSQGLLDVFDNQLKKLKYLGLMENPLRCTCDSYLSRWIRKSSVIIQPKNLTCSTPTTKALMTPVVIYEPEYFFCFVKTPLIISGSVLAAMILSVLLALPGYKYRWYLRHPMVVARAVAEKLNEVQFDEKCQYDAFISYDTSNNSASQWIVDKLIPAIETISDGESPTRSLQLNLYVVDRDSAVGSLKYTEKCRAIEASRKVIILLCNSYLANPACLSEADLVAVYQMVDGEHCYQPNRLLVLILEELNEQAIRSPVTSLLTQNVIHIVDDEVKMKRIWRRVRRFITKPKYIYRKKTKTLTTPQLAVDREPTETDPLIQ